MRYFSWLVLLVLFIFLIQLKSKNRVYLTVITVFFPLSLPLLSSKGVISTGTACIFFTYFLNSISSLKAESTIKHFYKKIIYSLIVVGAIATVLSFKDIPFSWWIIKEYLHFIAALLAFLLVVDLAQFEQNNKINMIEQFFSLFIVLMSIHIIISILQLKFPGFVQYLAIFDAKEFVEAGRGSLDKRIQDFVFRTESLGEIIAVLIPIILYKIFDKNKNLFFLFFFIFLVGLALTVLRSGLILFVFSFVLVFPLLSRRKPLKTVLFLYCGVGLSVVCFWFNQDIITGVVYRFEFIVNSSQNATFFDKINRSVFHQVIETYIMHPTLLGNGFIVPYNFHNLYFTIIYQLGIFGALIYFSLFGIVFIKLISTLLNSKYNKSIVYISIISFLCLMINECKYEFTRYESYYEICMFLIGCFALLGFNQKKTIEKIVDETNSRVSNIQAPYVE